jgi:hypothetical protein
VTAHKVSKKQTITAELPSFAAVGIRRFLCYDFFTKQAWTPDIGLVHSAWAKFLCDNPKLHTPERGVQGARGVCRGIRPPYWGRMNDQIEEA